MLGFKKKCDVTVSQLRKHAREVLRYRARLCAHCGYNDYVEVCHIVAVSKFSPEALLLEINDPSNLAFLCPNCHKQLDSGRLKPNLEWTNLYVEEDLEAVL